MQSIHKKESLLATNVQDEIERREALHNWPRLQVLLPFELSQRVNINVRVEEHNDLVLEAT